MKLSGIKLPFLIVFALLLTVPTIADAQEKKEKMEVKKEKKADKQLEKPSPKQKTAVKKGNCPESQSAWNKVEIEEHNADNYKNCVRTMSKQYASAKKMTSNEKNQMKQAMNSGYKKLIDFYQSGYGNDEEEADKLQKELNAMNLGGSQKKGGSKKTKNKSKS